MGKIHIKSPGEHQMMWSESYRPETIDSMVGNEEARAALVEWFSKWKIGLKPVLLIGPPGVGKTTAAALAGRAFGYDIIGLNASDMRNKKGINEVLLPLLGNLSIRGKPMIFVDEVDGIHGRNDFGGAEALLKILKEPTIPMVLAANSATSTKMKSIAKACKVIEFRALSPRLQMIYLQHVLKLEGVDLDTQSQMQAITASDGDMRSMMNAAQAFAGGFSPSIDRSFGVLDAQSGVESFFKSKTKQDAQKILYAMRMDPREKISAFYSSIITSTQKPEQMARLLDVLSRADILYGRIMSTQQWRLLRYLDGILLDLFEPDLKITYKQYNLPWPLLNRLRWEGRSFDKINAELAARVHVSKSTLAAMFLPYLLLCVKNKTIDLDLRQEGSSEALQKEVAKI